MRARRPGARAGAFLSAPRLPRASGGRGAPPVSDSIRRPVARRSGTDRVPVRAQDARRRYHPAEQPDRVVPERR